MLANIIQTKFKKKNLANKTKKISKKLSQTKQFRLANKNQLRNVSNQKTNIIRQK